MKLLSRKRTAKLELVERNPNPQLRREDGECVATFWHQATPGTTYWRCLVPARHLPGQSLPVTEDDLQLDADGRFVWPRQRGDAAVFQFLGDVVRSKFAFGMRQFMGTKLVLEVDDNYLRHAPYMYGKDKPVIWHKTIAEAKGGYSHEQHKLLLPEVDAIIASTPYLADVYGQYNDNVFVCPNSIDPADWQYEREPDDGVLRIVYYGGSSHVRDTPLVTEALKWAAAQDGVEVWTVGFKNPAWSFPYQTVPWSNDLEDARKNLFRFDVGIAPLTGNPWSRGKSDIKALEYAMAGVLPIVQEEEPYAPWWKKSRIGSRPFTWPWVAKTKSDWMELIQEAVRKPHVIRSDAGFAKEYVLSKRTIHSTIDSWKEAIA